MIKSYTKEVITVFFKKAKKSFDSSYDYLLVGLGNPGREYENTRHNAGFMVIDKICEEYGCKVEKIKHKSLLGECRMGDCRVLLAKPQTFMNLSGQAVQEIAAFYKIPPENTIIIFDDISLPVGKIRIRRNGSDGGHNGMKNIIYLSGSDRFPRIKVGVGAKPHPDYDLKDWVLSRFTGEDAKAIDTATKNAADAAKCIITDSVDSAMNKFSNR